MTSLLYALVGAALGVGLHLLVFIRGEWHIQAPKIVSYHLVYLGVLSLVISHARLVIASYFIALFSSIAIYRLFLHRLRPFPGPFWARISKLWHVWKARHCQNYLLLEALHRQYGDFVRTGNVYVENLPPSDQKLTTNSQFSRPR